MTRIDRVSIRFLAANLLADASSTPITFFVKCEEGCSGIVSFRMLW